MPGLTASYNLHRYTGSSLQCKHLFIPVYIWQFANLAVGLVKALVKDSTTTYRTPHLGTLWIVMDGWLKQKRFNSLYTTDDCCMFESVGYY